MEDEVGSRETGGGRQGQDENARDRKQPDQGVGFAGGPSEGVRLRSALADFFAAEARVLEWGAVPLDTRTSPAPHAADLRAWVADGFHADLGYMEARLDERADPRVFAPWAKTAVLFSLRQPVPFDVARAADDASSASFPSFRVAAYARGKDYHRVCHRILDRLEARLADVAPAVRFERFCDTAPVFERDLAAEAGLGWRGKNATLIHRKHGSGFLLAGFFLDADLAARAAPSPDFCGSCTACLTACPTDAFTAPGRLDANKCISYWTIEHKGEIPEELSSKFGDRIYGCDTCQDVCPWNRKPARRHAEELAARDPADRHADEPLAPGDWPHDATAWLTLLRRGGGFRSLLRHTPMKRAGRRMLLRNLLIAMRNTGTPLSDDWRKILAEEEDDEAVRKEIGKMKAET